MWQPLVRRAALSSIQATSTLTPAASAANVAFTGVAPRRLSSTAPLSFFIIPSARHAAPTPPFPLAPRAPSALSIATTRPAHSFGSPRPTTLPSHLAGLRRLHSRPVAAAVVAASAPRDDATAHPSWLAALVALGVVGAASAVASDAGVWPGNKGVIHCDARPYATKPTPGSGAIPPSDDEADVPIPESIVSVRSLGFGTACGLCAGVFIKKGAKLIAFFLGAGFVLLQYLSSQRLVSVNWKAMSARYDALVSRAAGGGGEAAGASSEGAVAVRVWNRFVHFLTADFQQRATFLAGLALGLRLG